VTAPRDHIRVAIADDHAVFRLGLRTLLADAPDIQVVGEAPDGEQAVALCDRLRPDVMLMDLSMAGMDGAAATRAIASRPPDADGLVTRVLVLTMHDEEEYLIPLLEAGASGYMVKSAAGKDLLNAVRAVAAGEVFVRPAAARVLARGWTRRAAQGEARATYATLSDRERDVLLLFAQGHSLAGIGERLSISPKTVDTYRRRVSDKTGLTERADFVRFALELGLLSADSA
jgi:DNA-binding NarL/FixJ family response regulator